MSSKIKRLKIKEWLRDGNDGLSKDIGTLKGLLEVAGRRLDKSCSWEIMGEILFKAADGKYYVGCVEFVVSRANPKYVKEVKDEIKNEYSHKSVGNARRT